MKSKYTKEARNLAFDTAAPDDQREDRFMLSYKKAKASGSSDQKAWKAGIESANSRDRGIKATESAISNGCDEDKAIDLGLRIAADGNKNRLFLARRTLQNEHSLKKSLAVKFARAILDNNR